jgi:putative multiple sugar transport system substrate-binding protein
MAGCAQGDTSGGGLKGDPAMIMVGISMTGEDQNTKAGEKIQSVLEEAGHTVELAYASSAKEQAEQLSALVEDGAAVLVVDPVNSLEVEKTLESGSTDVSGVSVIAYSVPISAPCVKAYVGPDVYAAGKEQAQRVVEQLGLEEAKKSGGKAQSVELIAGNGAERAIEGAMEVLQPYVDAGVVEMPSGTEAAECYTEDTAGRVQELCKGTYADREMGALLCLGEGQAVSAVEALMGSYTGAAFPVVTGCGCDEKAAEYLASHLLSMVALYEDTDPAQLAGEAIAAASGGEEWSDQVSKCTAVTADNYKELLVDSGLYTAHKGGTFTKN